MAKILRCNDLDPECMFQVRGNNEEEVLWAAAEHAKAKHGLANLPPELIPLVRNLIREERLERKC